MWLRAGYEVGPGYDRFAWLAHIRQIHGSRSRIVEIPPFRPSLSLFPFFPLRDDTRLLDVTRGGTSPGAPLVVSFFLLLVASWLLCHGLRSTVRDLDGLSTGDLSMGVYSSHRRGNRAANRVIPPPSIRRFSIVAQIRHRNSRDTHTRCATCLPDRDGSQVQERERTAFRESVFRYRLR